MAGFKSIRRSANFVLNEEIIPLTRQGKDYLDNNPEEYYVNKWLDEAQEAVEADSPLPARPQLSDLGSELLQLLWPE